MRKITPELSEILGLLCAEGSHIISHTSYWGKDKGRKRYFKNDKSERIEFYNKDKKLLTHYQELLQKEFDYLPKITKHNKINICKMSIIKKIITNTKLGHQKWKVPKTILTGNKTIKIRFLRGFFDGDGTISKSPRFISTNEKGIKQISKLLKQLEIKNTIQGPHKRKNRKPAYIVYIRSTEKQRFLNILKPISKRPDNLCEG